MPAHEAFLFTSILEKNNVAKFPPSGGVRLAVKWQGGVSPPNRVDKYTPCNIFEMFQNPVGVSCL